LATRKPKRYQTHAPAEKERRRPQLHRKRRGDREREESVSQWRTDTAVPVITLVIAASASLLIRRNRS